MHQTSLCEFQGELKCGIGKKVGGRNTEDYLWGYKYREFN